MIKNFYCFDCEAEFSYDLNKETMIEFTNDYGKWIGIVCLRCGGKAKTVGTPLNIANHTESRPVAIVENDKGYQVAVDKRGKEVKNIYQNDPRGWKRAGKKISEYNEYNQKLKDNYR